MQSLPFFFFFPPLFPRSPPPFPPPRPNPTHVGFLFFSHRRFFFLSPPVALPLADFPGLFSAKGRRSLFFLLEEGLFPYASFFRDFSCFVGRPFPPLFFFFRLCVFVFRCIRINQPLLFRRKTLPFFSLFPAPLLSSWQNSSNDIFSLSPFFFLMACITILCSFSPFSPPPHVATAPKNCSLFSSSKWETSPLFLAPCPSPSLQPQRLLRTR